MSKSSNNEEALRKRVYAFLDLHQKENKAFIVNHFRMENVPKSTMYDILQRKEKNIGPERKVGSGRTAKKMPKKQIKRLEKSIDKKDGVSQRTLAKRFNVSQPYIYLKLSTKRRASVIVKKLKHQKEHRLRKRLCVPSAENWFHFFGKKSLSSTTSRIFL